MAEERSGVEDGKHLLAQFDETSEGRFSRGERAQRAERQDLLQEIDRNGEVAVGAPEPEAAS